MLTGGYFRLRVPGLTLLLRPEGRLGTTPAAATRRRVVPSSILVPSPPSGAGRTDEVAGRSNDSTEREAQRRAESARQHRSSGGLAPRGSIRDGRQGASASPASAASAPRDAREDRGSGCGRSQGLGAGAMARREVDGAGRIQTGACIPPPESSGVRQQPAWAKCPTHKGAVGQGTDALIPRGSPRLQATRRAGACLPGSQRVRPQSPAGVRRACMVRGRDTPCRPPAPRRICAAFRLCGRRLRWVRGCVGRRPSVPKGRLPPRCWAPCPVPLPWPVDSATHTRADAARAQTATTPEA
eukprot:scaffold1883_cov108-Isochrysis_galbana.AAC.7